VLLDPTTNRLRVTLPRSMQGRAELQVSDMAGRVVMRQASNGAAEATMELGRLPDGLYSVIARTSDQAATARIIVRH
ncbi:MAG: T9SS type A sorting domain-containing protein, partial [Bacteroidetes bacterium]|nr:T9SS type A sorting domain-containing protein [Bacteroidota bacterium]